MGSHLLCSAGRGLYITVQAAYPVGRIHQRHLLLQYYSSPPLSKRGFDMAAAAAAHKEEVIGKLNVRVVRGSNLIIADPLTHTSDPYAVLSYGPQVRHRHIYPCSLDFFLSCVWGSFVTELRILGIRGSGGGSSIDLPRCP